MQRLMAAIAYLERKNVQLVLDRGFYSESHISSLYRKRRKFLISMRVSLGIVKSHLEEVRESMVTRSHYSSKF